MEYYLASEEVILSFGIGMKFKGIMLHDETWGHYAEWNKSEKER